MVKMTEGKNKVLLFRLLSKQGDEAAKKLVFQTNHSFSYSRELDRVVTKDGSLVKVGGLEAEVEIEAIAAQGDKVSAMLKDSVKDGEKLELWEVEIDPDDDVGPYNAVYAQGYLESWEESSDAEDESEVTGTFIVDLVPQEGTTTLDAEQLAAVQYAFTDTEAVV